MLGTRLLFRPRLAPGHAMPSLLPPNRVQNLHQPEFNLPPLHVHADDLHTHLVTETIDPLGVLAAQHVLLLEEAVVVVRHARAVDEPFAVMLNQLAEASKRRNAGDVAL